MDSFVRNFFPEYKTPGVEFQFDQRPQIWCFSSGILKTSVDDSQRSASREIRQPMTPLGKLSANLEGMGSVYDGISKQYLTPEGQINFEAISNNLKLMTGKSNSEVAGFIAAAQSMRWDDNHISLLFNMLRYVMLKKISEVTGSLNGSLGHFTEGTLDIDMDQFWGEGYPAQCAFTTWPTQPELRGDETMYVGVSRLLEPFPTETASVLDLRGLSREQMLFTLIMLNSWERKSRFKLDFTLDTLTHAVQYRGDLDVDDAYGDWANGTTPLAMPTAEQAWMALRRYVTQNRLYGHFSTALFLTAALTYQFVPETAEGIAWLELDWAVVLPTFFSIRGRTASLNTGDAAFLNQRPLDEWGYLANMLEKINLMALVFSQAFYTGLAMRSVRKCLELEPQDLYQTDSTFYNVENLVSAAASEFTRLPAPLSGASGIYVTAHTWLDDWETGRQVITNNPVGTPLPDTHTYGEIEREEAQDVMVETEPTTWPDTQANKQEEVQRVRMIAAGYAAKTGVVATYVGTADELAAARGMLLVPGPRHVRARVRTVQVPMMTFPGYPVFLTPISPFPYATLYQEAGKFDENTGKLEKRGNVLTLHEAWRVLNFLSLCGYAADYDVKGKVAGAKAFLHGRYSRQLWPVLYEPEDSEDPVILRRQQATADAPLELPIMCNKFFKSHIVQYKYAVNRRGVANGPRQFGVDITEFGGHVQLLKASATVAYQVDEGVKRVRGWITRDNQD